MSTAQVIPFKKPSQPKEQGAVKNMYSDKFEQGYVMSSRLYRKEVWPFISDAARNVYAELESRINGHNKESDFVSYSQLQGSNLPGARQLSRRTVSIALKELIKLGVITVMASGKQGMKSYRLNEISIKDKFTNETSVVSTPVHLVNQTSVVSTPVTSVVSKHTIDSSIDTLDNNEITREKFEPQNRSMMSFIEYHPRDLKSYSLKELTQTYSAQSDFQSQAKVSFPDFTAEQILSQLKKLAQWSLSAETRSPQKWMTCWLNWLSNFQNSSQTKPANNKPPAPQKPKHHRYGSGAVSGDNS